MAWTNLTQGLAWHEIARHAVGQDGMGRTGMGEKIMYASCPDTENKSLSFRFRSEKRRTLDHECSRLPISLDRQGEGEGHLTSPPSSGIARPAASNICRSLLQQRRRRFCSACSPTTALVQRPCEHLATPNNPNEGRK